MTLRLQGRALAVEREPESPRSLFVLSTLKGTLKQVNSWSSVAVSTSSWGKS